MNEPLGISMDVLRFHSSGLTTNIPLISWSLHCTYLVPVGDEGDADVLLVVGSAQEFHSVRDQHVPVDVTSDVRDQHDNQCNLKH